LLGLKNGAIYTVIRTVGLVGAIVLAAFLCKPLQNLITTHTGIYTAYADRIKEACDGFANEFLINKLNPTFSANGAIANASETIANGIADKFAKATFAAVLFILLVILIKIILALIIRLFSKKHHNGFIGGIDGGFGFVVGLVQGAILVMVILLILTPASLLFFPGAYPFIINQLDTSIFTSFLHEHNPLLTLIGGGLPDNLIVDNLLEKIPT
jgi:uncharacterized membrane protein required for colicin V production